MKGFWLKLMGVVATMRIALVVMLAALGATLALASYQVGDRVEGWNYGWYKGSIVKIGTGSYAGYYLLHHDDYSIDAYYSEKNLRKLGAAKSSAPSDAAAGKAPSAGRADAANLPGKAPGGEYLCGVMLGGRFTTVQRIHLRDGRYTSNRGAGGRFTYDAAQRLINFDGGSLADLVGRHEPENKGIVRLTQRKDLGEGAMTQKWRSQICSPQS